MSFYPEIQEKRPKSIQNRLKMIKYSCFLELILSGKAGKLAGLKIAQAEEGSKLADILAG